ncbi:ABC transporter substrate-binding protein [Halobacterium bonnevillei]|uniref:ABC transporter substrate-binding protein n=1 Tax=Halobacterium bonnevillei TaxID=2692200 RepID=A0A6B0SLD6_9EURY|nr:ABC transporter substrate-binding protein [Halobacterium bonnevillei]MXR21296.1 ABC transporter substrate-binding protein [Halobacterium bonnevillei]
MAGNDSQLSRRSFLKAAGSATVAATATSSVAGCLGGGGDGGGTLRYGRSAHSDTLDPQNTTSGEVSKVTNQIYDGLINFTPGEATLEKSLATDWTMDGESVTLQLREDAQFDDGTDFTADDFIATYRRFVDEDYEYHFEESSVYGPFTLGNWIDSVEKDGDYTLNITLTQPYAPFLRNLAMFAAVVMSKDDVESDFNFNQDANGTGPFQLDELDNANGRIRLTPNDNYWGDGPQVSELLFIERGQNSTRAQALVEEELEIIDNLDPDTISTVEDADNAAVESGQGINIGYMVFNQSRVEAFRDTRVRQAISYAIDTQSIVEEVYEGIATDANQPCPPALFGHNPDIEAYPQDLEKAKSLLEEAGYGDGFSFQLTTFQNARGYNPAPLPTAETIRTNLGEIGITVEIDDRQFGDYLTYTGEGRHDASLSGWYTDNADPDNFMYVLLHPQVESPEGQDYVDWGTEGFNTSNRAAWANEEYMSLVEEAQRTADQSSREDLYHEAAQIAHDEAPWVYIDYADEVRGVRENVSNYTVSAIGGPHLHLVEVE